MEIDRRQVVRAAGAGLFALGIPSLFAACRERAEAPAADLSQDPVLVAARAKGRSALVFRGMAVPPAQVLAQWPVIVNLLAGSLLGAWLAAGWAVRLNERTLHRVIAVLLLLIAIVLVLGHGHGSGQPALAGAGREVDGVGIELRAVEYKLAHDRILRIH